MKYTLGFINDTIQVAIFTYLVEHKSTFEQLTLPTFTCEMFLHLHLKTGICRDFPGGPVVKNLPSDAEDMGLIPGQGTKIPHAAGQLSPHATTTELASFN